MEGLEGSSLGCQPWKKNSRASRPFGCGKKIASIPCVFVREAANGQLRRAELKPGFEVRDGREKPGSKSKNEERQKGNLPASVAQTQGNEMKTK